MWSTYNLYLDYCLPNFKMCNCQVPIRDLPRQLSIKTNKKTNIKTSLLSHPSLIPFYHVILCLQYVWITFYCSKYFILCISWCNLGIHLIFILIFIASWSDKYMFLIVLLLTNWWSTVSLTYTWSMRDPDIWVGSVIIFV